LVAELLLGSLGFIGCSKDHGGVRTGQPNIIFIMTDDHTELAISSFGSELINTPNIDCIAEKGIRFDLVPES
jgi:arylsulfatase A-like enzyme